MYLRQKTRQFNPNYSTFTQEYFKKQEVEKKTFPNRKKKKEYNFQIELKELTIQNSYDLRPKSEFRSIRKKKDYKDIISRCQQTIERVNYSLNRTDGQKVLIEDWDDYGKLQQLQIKQLKPVSQDEVKVKHPLKRLIEKYEDLLDDGYNNLSIQMQNILDKHKFELNIQKKSVDKDQKRCQSSQIHQRGRRYSNKLQDSITKDRDSISRSVNLNNNEQQNRSAQQSKKVEKKNQIIKMNQLLMIDDGFKMRYQDFVEDNKKINLKDLISITNYEKF